jgi:ABC-2 type transport system permease protein
MTAAALPARGTAPRPGSLRANLRLFWLGGLISYRALFNWARPSIYIPTLIGAPTFQILFFAALGPYATGLDAEFFAIGNAVQVSAMSGIYGMTMAIANERWFGTLHALLATPASRWAIFGGRFIPFIANGLIVSIYGFTISWLFLGVDIAPGSLGVVALGLVATVFSCSAIGAVQGGLSMRLRDGLFGANLLVFLFLLFCGVNIPLEVLPGWMQVVSNFLPFTHGLEAIRAAVAGAGLDEVGGLIAIEFGIGAVYALLAFGLFSYLERSARQNATLDVR